MKIIKLHNKSRCTVFLSQENVFLICTHKSTELWPWTIFLPMSFEIHIPNHGSTMLSEISWIEIQTNCKFYITFPVKVKFVAIKLAIEFIQMHLTMIIVQSNALNKLNWWVSVVIIGKDWHINQRTTAHWPNLKMFFFLLFSQLRE